MLANRNSFSSCKTARELRAACQEVVLVQVSWYVR